VKIATTILTNVVLGLGIEAPWKLVDQRLDTDKQPHELHLTIKADRGAKYACPVCGKACAAWRLPIFSPD